MNIRPFGRFVLGSVLAMLSVSAQAAHPSTFKVRRDAVASDSVRFLVEGRFARPMTQLALFHFPSAERPQAQSASIRDLRAFDVAGREIEVDFAGEGKWSAKDGITRITYRLVADHDRVRWGPGKDEVATHFDRSWFFVGNAFFLIDPSYDAPVRVHFDLPAGWQATAPWRTEGKYRVANNADDLQQNAFAVGPDRALHFETHGIPITLLVDSRLEKSRSRLVELLQGLPRLYADFWQQNLTKPVTIFAFADPQTDGGAFRSSFALRVAEAQTAVDERVWTHLLGHELMHLWLGSGRIRGDASGSLYWFLEGATDYLTARLMRQADLIDEDMYDVRLANFVRRYLFGVRLTPKMSLAQAGAEKSRHYELIYGGGALFAMLLDREMESGGRSGGCQPLFADLYRLADMPMNEKQLLAILDKGSEGKASELLGWINGAPSLEALQARLGHARLRMAVFTPDEIYVEQH